jgi:hypothetical protein
MVKFVVLYCKTIPLMYVHCTAQTRVQFLNYQVISLLITDGQIKNQF